MPEEETNTEPEAQAEPEEKDATEDNPKSAKADSKPTSAAKETRRGRG